MKLKKKESERIDAIKIPQNISDLSTIKWGEVERFFVRCLTALLVMIIQNISYAMLTSILFAGQDVKTMLHF